MTTWCISSNRPMGSFSKKCKNMPPTGFELATFDCDGGRNEERSVLYSRMDLCNADLPHFVLLLQEITLWRKAEKLGRKPVLYGGHSMPDQISSSGASSSSAVDGGGNGAQSPPTTAGSFE